MLLEHSIDRLTRGFDEYSEAQRGVHPALTVVERLQRGGRLIYVGAGTAGRLGLLDAAECPPTFNTDRVIAVMAGGPNAFLFSQGGEEDDTAAGAADMDRTGVTEIDAVVGVAAVVTLDKEGTCTKVGIGVTGAGTKAVRAKGVEAGLAGKKLDAATIEAAAQKAAEGIDVQADLQGSVEYKSHLCRVFAKRAVTEAVKRARG